MLETLEEQIPSVLVSGLGYDRGLNFYLYYFGGSIL